MVETTLGLDDIFNIIESKCVSLFSNYKVKNYRECVSAQFFIAESIIRYVLATRGYFPISHEGIQVLLAQHFIKAGIVDKKIYNYVTNLYMRRKDADYKGFIDFDKEDIVTYWQWIVEIVGALHGFFNDTHKQKLLSLVDEGNKYIN